MIHRSNRIKLIVHVIMNRYLRPKKNQLREAIFLKLLYTHLVLYYTDSSLNLGYDFITSPFYWNFKFWNQKMNIESIGRIEIEVGIKDYSTSSKQKLTNRSRSVNTAYKSFRNFSLAVTFLQMMYLTWRKT